MEKKNINFKELTEHILKSYLDSDSGEDMQIFELLDENLSVIGTGKQEFYKNLQEFARSFQFDVERRETIRFRWKDFKAEEQKIDDDHVLVYGSVLIVGAYPGGYTCVRMDTRFTILYGFVDGTWKVLHIHHSVPDKEQMQNEEFPQTLGRQIEESQHMIMALAGDYVAVYMVEPETDLARVVKLDPVIVEKSDNIPEEFSYSQMFRRYADTHISEKDREKFLSIVLPDAMARIFSDGREKFELNYRVQRNGRQIHYSGLFVRISKPGKALKLIVGFRNIEDIVNIQKKTREKDEKLDEMHEILEASSMGTWNICMIDGKAPTMEADDLMKELLGIKGKDLTPEEVYNAWYSNITPAALPSVLDSVERMKEGVRSENTYLWKHPVLGERYVRCGGTARPVDGGYLLRGYHYDVDKAVREQKQKDKEHAEVINSLSTIYSTIFRAEIDTHRYEMLFSVPLMSKIAAKTGSFDDIKEQVIDAFIEPEFRASLRDFLDLDTLADRLEKTNTVTIDYKAPTGQWMKVRFIVKRRDEEGRAKEVLYVARDITLEKTHDFERQEALMHALAQTRQANKAKTVFLNSMSHDIRTPMNAIIGFTALAQAHIGEQEQVQDYLNKISASSAHLLSLINDVLDMSRIESGTVKLEEKPVHITGLLHDLYAMIQSLVNSRNQNFHIDTQDVIHEEVLTDKLRLNQVLLNIVGNAIKFTQPGGDIMIRLVEEPCTLKNRAIYKFIVKDNGIGMSREFLEHIFDTFSREYSSTISGIQGTGLGMAITKNLVDMMGGDIHVESEEGKGSRFVVTFNLRLVNDCEEVQTQQGTGEELTGGTEKKRKHDYSGKRALLVEDNELNREIAIAILEETGMEIDSVNDGDIAVSTINEAPTDKYDLIFMDIQMPKMDGYTATREIRTLPDNRKANLPIVAMTADAFEEDKRKSYESGMNGHITKPISIEAIAKVLDEIFDSET